MISIKEAEATVREALGDRYGVVRLGGYWVIGNMVDGKWVGPAAQSKTLERAIDEVKTANEDRHCPSCGVKLNADGTADAIDGEGHFADCRA